MVRAGGLFSQNSRKVFLAPPGMKLSRVDQA